MLRHFVTSRGRTNWLAAAEDPPLAFSGRRSGPSLQLCPFKLSLALSRSSASILARNVCYASAQNLDPEFSRPPQQFSSNLPLVDPEHKDDIARKVSRIILSAVFALNVVGLLQTGPAYANVQLNLANGSASAGGRQLLVSAWMGLMAGCLHTLTGPDHLAALAPLSIGRTAFESIAVGALWGCGHDAGQVIFGLLFLVLKDKLHIEFLRIWGARIVAMTLLTIGAVGIKEAREVAIPCLAANGNSTIFAPFEGERMVKKKIGLATFATGIVHGLQPDALLIILPAVALPSRFAGAAFLGMFLLGTIFAMSGYTAFIGSCSHALKSKVPRITEHLAWGSSLVAISVGTLILGSEMFGLTIF